MINPTIAAPHTHQQALLNFGKSAVRVNNPNAPLRTAVIPNNVSIIIFFSVFMPVG